MREWWWWWLPGWHKKWTLEKLRSETLSTIRVERSLVEEVAQRPRTSEDILDGSLLADVRLRLAEIEKSAQEATNADDLDDLIGFAERQGQLRSYLCPVAEIQGEGSLAIDLIEEWGVPKTVIEKLYKSHVEKLKKAESNPDDARGALRALLNERDSWADYTDDYEDQMKVYTRWLSAGAVILPMLAVIAFHWASIFCPLLVFGLLSAGVAGSCVSVLAKMPLLDVALSAELEAYGRRILSRIGVGVGASLIGCALFGWSLPISIQNQTFADSLSACSASPAVSCAGIKTLILLGVPMLLGFSERALTSFEQRVFGNPKTGAKK
jgi:hypothetical protein